MKMTLRILLFGLLAAAGVNLGFAQITTSTISGKITDSKGEDLPGATILLVYKPTNASYGVSTNVDGRFTLANLNPGGPYEATISFVGSHTEKVENLFLKLGETQILNFSLKDEAQTLNEVTVLGVTADATEKFGAGTSVGKEQIQQLPTLTRSFSDFTRLTPQSSNNSFAGTNFRYNNITLDGAINNDAIGFSPSLGGISGTANQPGSSTRTNSFSLDAVQEVQVQVAPYDVSLGNFTGGSINAVSRSGSNDLSGSIYGFGRNASITGKYKGGDKVGNGSLSSQYYDYQEGFRVGFPLVKDKLFLFTNEEVTRNRIPVLFPAGSPNYFMTDAIAQQIINKLETMPVTPYNPAGGFDPGAIHDYSIYSQSRKFFNRLDWIINKNHSLVLRNNTIISEASNLERSTQEFQFGSYDFIQHNHNSSTVMELKSRFGNNMSNSLIAGYTDIKDSRDPTGTVFPQIQINGIGGGHALIGTNREAGIFNMRQRTFEFTDNFKVFTGNHTLTFGTHNEFYKIDYVFINSWNGRYDYGSLNAFLTDTPSRMRALYSSTDNSRENLLTNSPAKFPVALGSVYAQDEWIKGKLRLTYGLRADLPLLPTGPNGTARANFPTNPANYGTTYTYGTPISQISNKYLGNVYVSPRIGFNYDLKGDQSIVLRGGSGVFTGRIPFAWFGYTYVNNGSTFNALDLNPPKAGTAIPTDPSTYGAFAAANGSKNRTEIDLLDKNFSLPRMWRSNMAVDFNIAGGYKLTVEALYTKTIKDLQIKQVNLKDSVYYANYDVNKVQPLYFAAAAGTGNRVSNNFSSVYLLTNTNRGYRYQFTVQLSKSYPMGIKAMVAYNYGQSKDILNGIRNSPESGWQTNQALIPNTPSLNYSNFDIRHRIVSTVQYKKTWGTSMASYISLIYTSQSGSPYSYGLTSNNKLTNNGQQVDLFYVPKVGENPYNLAAGQQQAFDQFINSDKYLSSRRGQFTERNGARTPWNNQLDFRFMHDFYMNVSKKTRTLQFTFDIINLSNMINAKWGVYYFTPNTINSSVDPGLSVTSRTVTNGVVNVNATYTTPNSKYSIDQFSSRWQAQAGLRYIF
jgi:Carboxypeptidase regulatory-like domain